MLNHVRLGGFLADFKHRSSVAEQKFCWILGSGASASSGIPTGGQMVDQWLRWLYEADPKCESFNDFDTWLQSVEFNFPNWNPKNPAASYPYIFQERFYGNLDSGYAYLEDAISKKRPGAGYIILSQIMASTAHKVVITSNFDDLVADALRIYTTKDARECVHESLAHFAFNVVRNPIILKIHRGLLFDPKNSPETIATLAPGWRDPLASILSQYSPIVMGYGGHDATLMDFLLSRAQESSGNGILGGVTWCFREESEIAGNDKIHELVKLSKGRLVKIGGFDECMLELGSQIGLPDIHRQIELNFSETLNNYRNAYRECLGAIFSERHLRKDDASLSVKKALLDTIPGELSKRSWWDWEVLARTQESLSAKRKVYQLGLQTIDCPTLRSCLAAHLMDEGDYVSAQSQFEIAYASITRIRSRHEKGRMCGNYALVLDRFENKALAEQVFRESLQYDNGVAIRYANFARFLHYRGINLAEAKEMYAKSLELKRRDPDVIGDYAILLWQLNEDRELVAKEFKAALAINATHKKNIQNFELFKKGVTIK